MGNLPAKNLNDAQMGQNQRIGDGKIEKDVSCLFFADEDPLKIMILMNQRKILA